MSITYRSALARLPARIAAKIAPPDENGCWIWAASKIKQGYGQTSYKGVRCSSHRLVYTLLIGPIPEGLHLDHVKARGCRSRACCNPAHLEPVTCLENIRRGETGATNREKTHCPQGHPYDGDNLSVRPGGQRVCLACSRARDKIRRPAKGPPNGEKTHCPQGHEYTAQNTRIVNGSRICKACDLARHNAKYVPKGKPPRKTHCPRGHEYTPENTYVQPSNGGRVCRICKRAKKPGGGSSSPAPSRT